MNNEIQNSRRFACFVVFIFATVANVTCFQGVFVILFQIVPRLYSNDLIIFVSLQ